MSNETLNQLINNLAPYKASLEMLESLQANTLANVEKIDGVYYDVYRDGLGNVIACNVESENEVFLSELAGYGTPYFDIMIGEINKEINNGLFYAHSDDNGDTCHAFKVAGHLISKELDAAAYVLYTLDGEEIGRFDDTVHCAETVADSFLTEL